MRHLVFVLTLAILVSPAAAVQYDLAFPNLTFDFPVDIQSANDGSNRVFVVEQAGRIWVFPNNPAVASKTLFLDISAQVDGNGGEEGLLSIAFHPSYPDSPYFYVDYTANGPPRSMISRFTVDATDSNVVVPGSEFFVLQVPRIGEYHNAGKIAFGPDEYLYIAQGEGGDSQLGQLRTELLGNVLRIDVDATQGPLNYAIPASNPFVGNPNGWREEIYAYGFRNPWRFSFDFPTGRLWLGDVGQNFREEVNIVESGKNYGWDIFEGTLCFSPPCTTSGLTPPIWEYGHPPGGAVVGGYVYRGSSYPGGHGRYIYGDFNSGLVWVLDYDGVNPPTNTLLLDTGLLLSSFGIDEQQEIYFCSWIPGAIYKLSEIPTGIGGDTPVLPIALDQNVPNPFNPGTRIRFTMPETAHARLTVYDVTGRLVATLVDDVVSEGENFVDWVATGLPSGSYYYLLTVGNFSQSRKMTYLK